MKKGILIMVGAALAVMGQAQSDERLWSIGLHGGLTQYNGDRGQNFYSLQQNAYGFGRISLSRFISPHFDASLFMTRGQIGNSEAASSWSTPKDIGQSHFRAQLNTANLVLRYHITKPQSIVRPYVFAGAGLILYEKKYTIPKQQWEGSTPTFGLGASFRLNEYMRLSLEETFMYTTTDKIDRTVGGATNDSYLYHTAGLLFDFGKVPDEDMDGISDKKDVCSSTPMGVEVDKAGCPLDRDKDGVADYYDDCPDAFGGLVLAGCPDADFDGVADREDRCPNDAGPLSSSGCPDSDKDGIVDIDDKCQGTAAKYRVDSKGCPVDDDHDGVINEDDRCPNIPGLLSLQGCADSDVDGVSDIDDRCPMTTGAIANKGCPELPKEIQQQILIIASKIFFQTGNAILKPESEAQLDALVSIMNRYEGVILVIEGHTDNVGDDAMNMDLSTRRAETVKLYLMAKGIDASRLIAIGFGETKPIADNSTSAGRSKNRRVEIRTTYELPAK